MSLTIISVHTVNITVSTVITSSIASIAWAAIGIPPPVVSSVLFLNCGLKLVSTESSEVVAGRKPE